MGNVLRHTRLWMALEGCWLHSCALIDERDVRWSVA